MPDPAGPPPNPDRDFADARDKAIEAAAAELVPFWDAVKNRHGLTTIEQVFLLNTVVGRAAQVECLLERQRNRAAKKPVTYPEVPPQG